MTVDNIGNEEQLEQKLTTPTSALVNFIKTVPCPLLVLGAGGKMGPTLAVLAKRAADAAGHSVEVVAVSRFSDASARTWLERHDIKIIAKDLTQVQSLEGLPDSQTVIYLVGQKFGTSQNPAATWAINTIVPAKVAERYPSARIVGVSTGNVYPLSAVTRGGSVETDPLTPIGEYANATVGRERIFEFYSQAHNTRVALLRLFYAVELRYGVLVDIARKVHNREPIELANGYFNCIWQGDANELVLRALALASAPPSVWNLCRPEIFSVREVATRFGEALGVSPSFVGTEAPTALLGNSSKLCAKLGSPSVTLETMLDWIARWVAQGGRLLGKPTHFEVRDGKY
jgi:nucleoside-diphosphate-sugar epimerase